MKSLLIFLVAGAAASSLGCVSIVGSGNPATENRVLGAFDKIDVSGSVEVLVGISDEISCKVTGDDNIVPTIKTELAGSTLRIYEEKSYRSKLPVKILLTVPDIREIDLSGSGKVVVHGVKRDDLGVQVSGSGSAMLTGVDVTTLRTDISGSGAITARGVASVLKSRVSGSGSGNFTYLCADDAKVEISGSGTTSLVALKTLDVRVSGSGAVHYGGMPTLSQKISGSGAVKPIPTETVCKQRPAN